MKTLSSRLACMSIEVTKVPDTAKMEKTSQELLRKRCHDRPTMRIMMLAIKIMVRTRKI
jgi:hypothetical protein